MKSNKCLKKAVAVMVTLAFCCLLTNGTLPAKTTAPAPDQQDQPGVIQKQVSVDYETEGKKFPLVPILIGVAVAAVLVAFTVLVVLKDIYNIRGTWQVTKTLTGTDPLTFEVTFTGEKDSGDVYAFQAGVNIYGTYTADGKDVYWELDSGSTFTGTFSDSNHLSGDTTHYGGLTGTWTAFRLSWY